MNTNIVSKILTALVFVAAVISAAPLRAAAPTVTTSAATEVTATKATLNGTVNAGNENTLVSFDYGTTTTYGQSANGTPLQATGGAATALSASVSGLIPNTTYYFRVKGVNPSGTVSGSQMSFTTSLAPLKVKVESEYGKEKITPRAGTIEVPIGSEQKFSAPLHVFLNRDFVELDPPYAEPGSSDQSKVPYYRARRVGYAINRHLVRFIMFIIMFINTILYF